MCRPDALTAAELAALLARSQSEPYAAWLFLRLLRESARAAEEPSSPSGLPGLFSAVRAMLERPAAARAAWRLVDVSGQRVEEGF
jgi:hypothetical protein